MSLPQEYPDVETALQDYLRTKNNILIGHGNQTLPIFTQDFPPNNSANATAIMIRDNGGYSWLDIFVLKLTVQIWARAPEPSDAKKLISRVFGLLDKFGPDVLNENVYAYNIRMNTGRQRLDSLDSSELAQYFMIFEMTVREC